MRAVVLPGEDARDALCRLSDGDIQTTFTDPPYNIGHPYGPVSDRLPHAEYLAVLRETLALLFQKTAGDGSLFVVHYNKFFLENLSLIIGEWSVHQSLTWCYASNIGHSKKRWTTASRTVVWLSKSETPKFHRLAVPQPYRNPTDRRVARLIANGSPGTALYDWWNIELTKNVNEEKEDYSNQIPTELIRRVVVSTTNEDDLVADPFGGTFSTARVALAERRRAWSCDKNPETERFTGFLDGPRYLTVL